MSVEIMLEKAKTARENAYARYSNFAVGCCLLADDGQYYIGTNVENACYPCGDCAEPIAIGAMITAGAKQIKEILVIGSNDKYCYPCGNCRQKIGEFATADTLVHAVTQQGDVNTVRFDELLSHQFELT